MLQWQQNTWSREDPEKLKSCKTILASPCLVLGAWKTAKNWASGWYRLQKEASAWTLWALVMSIDPQVGGAGCLQVLAEQGLGIQTASTKDSPCMLHATFSISLDSFPCQGCSNPISSWELGVLSEHAGSWSMAWSACSAWFAWVSLWLLLGPQKPPRKRGAPRGWWPRPCWALGGRGKGHCREPQPSQGGLKIVSAGNRNQPSEKHPGNHQVLKPFEVGLNDTAN